MFRPRARGLFDDADVDFVVEKRWSSSSRVYLFSDSFGVFYTDRKDTPKILNPQNLPPHSTPRTLAAIIMTGVEHAAAWKALEAHYATTMATTHVKDLFASNPRRFDEMSLHFDDDALLVDYSKNCVTSETMKYLSPWPTNAASFGRRRTCMPDPKLT
jgi:hypothetical protein